MNVPSVRAQGCEGVSGGQRPSAGVPPVVPGEQRAGPGGAGVRLRGGRRVRAGVADGSAGGGGAAGGAGAVGRRAVHRHRAAVPACPGRGPLAP